MDIGQWINDNKLIILIFIVLFISILFNIFAAPIQPPEVNIPTTSPVSLSTIINSTNWVWIWPLITAIPILLIAVFNWRTIFQTNINNSITSDICSIIPGTNSFVTRVPSYYFANISFFFSYLFMNALSNYNMESDPSVDKSLVDNRQYRSAATMFILIFVFLGLIILRYNTSNCDSILGIIVTISIFTAFGLLWYKVAEYCGAKGTDLMGISQNIISPKAKAPVVCKRTIS